jgi:hypothetical protein
MLGSAVVALNEPLKGGSILLSFIVSFFPLHFFPWLQSLIILPL